MEGKREERGLLSEVLPFYYIANNRFVSGIRLAAVSEAV